MTPWRKKEVGNEIQSREINELIDGSNEAGDTEPASRYVCECSGEACTATIALTHLEYEEVRAHGAHFAIARNHESPDLDLLVSEREGFAIVRKVPGFPANLATASDPRTPRAIR